MIGNRGRNLRLFSVVVLLGFGLTVIFKSKLPPDRTNLLVTAIVGAITAVYVLINYEILLQNQQMSKAAVDTASYTEKSLRYNSSAHLVFSTFSVNTPDLRASHPSLDVLVNDDYRRALELLGQDQAEFVFAAVENKGPSVATKISIDATYAIVDSSTLNRESTIAKRASITTIDPQKGIAFCVFISRVPTPDDRVSLSSATLQFNDFYRDALGEVLQQEKIDTHTHMTRPLRDGVILLK